MALPVGLRGRSAYEPTRYAKVATASNGRQVELYRLVDEKSMYRAIDT